MYGMKVTVAVILIQLGLGLGAGCATTSCGGVSAEQETAFRAAVERAKQAGADEPYSPAASKLREAEASFYYAQHLPSDPERAHQLATQAREEAEAAGQLAQSNREKAAVSVAEPTPAP